MLANLEITNFALIEQLNMEPGRGLLILTGETGAGKSILIDAIGALSGERMSKDLIRHGQSTARIEALFILNRNDVPESLAEEWGLDDTFNESGQCELVLSREMSDNGRSVCRVNGRLTTVTALRDVSASLIDIHGQHEQQSIFRIESHRRLLDRYGGEPVERALRAYTKELETLKAHISELNKLGKDPSERARQIDLLSFQVNEIERAQIKENEDEKLSERRNILAHAEKIRQALSEAYERLASDDQDGVLANLGSIVACLESVQHLTDTIQPVQQTVEGAQDMLQTVIGDLRRTLDTLESDPYELDQIEERMDQLFKLKKKYGGSLDAIHDYLEQASARLEQLSGGAEQYEALLKEKEKLTNIVLKRALDLRENRKAASLQMEKRIAEELADLGMSGVRFKVKITPIAVENQNFPPHGCDHIEFLISANPGEPLRPLARIASGGEAARIMLAIKTILSEVDSIPVLIFDEIDTGVSGQTAGRVGEKLRQLSGHHQVFCITHMAQIAAMADEHFLIEKTIAGGRTRTRMKKLDEDEREAELARLLSGGVADDEARKLAVQLRSKVRSPRDLENR